MKFGDIMDIRKLYNILLEDNPSKELLNNEEELFKLIPELRTCKGFNQNSDWHIYDVYNHILHVVDYVPSDLVLRLAALFHDVGKPISYKEDENGIGHFYGHWEESQKIFESFSNKYNLDKNMSNTISNLIYYHDMNIGKLNDLELKKIYNIFGIDGIDKLYKLKEADLLAQNKKYHYILKDYDKQKSKIIIKKK